MVGFLFLQKINSEDLTFSMHSFSAVKRLMKEAQELNEPTEQYYAQPLEVS